MFRLREMRLKVIPDRDLPDRRPERPYRDRVFVQPPPHRARLLFRQLGDAAPIDAAQLDQRDPLFLQRRDLPHKIGRRFIGKCTDPYLYHRCLHLFFPPIIALKSYIQAQFTLIILHFVLRYAIMRICSICIGSTKIPIFIM